MAPKFEGFTKSAPQGKPMTRAVLMRQEAQEAHDGGDVPDDEATEVEPRNGNGAAAPVREVSAWTGSEVYDLQKFAVSIKENTEEVLDRVGSKFDEVMRLHLTKQEELAKQQARLIERLTEYNKRESTFLFAIVGTLVLFAIIYILK